jgi:hypothetical protein
MSDKIERRHANLKLEHGPSGPIIRARIPTEMSEAEFAKVAVTAYGLVHNLTGCNCLSGRISFVTEDVFADVINVAFD